MTNEVPSIKTQLQSAVQNNNVQKAKALLIANAHFIHKIELQSVLDKLGFEYDVANNGEQGVDKLNNHQYHVIVTECCLPKLDGDQLTQKVRSNQLACKPDNIIIGLGIQAPKNRILACFNAGMNHIIHKPVHVSNFTQTIESLLSNYIPCNTSQAPIDPNKVMTELLTAPLMDDETAVLYLSDSVQTIDRYRSKFIVMNAYLIDEIKNAFQDEDVYAMFLHSHKLKSSSLYIGALRLHLMAKYIESITKDQEAIAVQTATAIEHLSTIFDQLKTHPALINSATTNN